MPVSLFGDKYIADGGLRLLHPSSTVTSPEQGYFLNSCCGHWTGAVGRAESVRAPATRVSVKNRIIAPPETMAKDEEPGILPASEDAYGGVIVDKRSLPASPEIFEKSLAMSLEVGGTIVCALVCAPLAAPLKIVIRAEENNQLSSRYIFCGWRM
jgi:hypothetical protein